MTHGCDAGSGCKKMLKTLDDEVVGNQTMMIERVKNALECRTELTENDW